MDLNADLYINKKLVKFFVYLFWAGVLALFIAASTKYLGQWHIYLLFTVTLNLLLYCGFRKKAIFFDTFIGVFFWLGFWLKLTERILTNRGFYFAPYFDGSGAAFDKGLIIASCGILGLILASFIREKFWFVYPSSPQNIFRHHGLFKFYQCYRRSIWLAFLALIVIIGFSNLYYGIYQRGALPQTQLPFGLNGVYTWLLMFGLASISATIIRLELALNSTNIGTTISIGLFESFISNTSMLSRGMLLQASGLLCGIISIIIKKRASINLKSFIFPSICFIVFFIGSVSFVNYYRLWFYHSSLSAPPAENVVSKNSNKVMATSLFLDRWLGIEEVFAVSSSTALGWKTWNQAWEEKPTAPTETTHFFNRVFTKTPSIQIDRSKFHFIESLPGVVAFFFYPSSLTFLITALFLLGLFAAFLEYLAFRLSGGNLILCSVFAQVIAFRYMNFGYIPSQSYLLVGALVGNAILIYFINKLLENFHTKEI